MKDNSLLRPLATSNADIADLSLRILAGLRPVPGDLPSSRPQATTHSDRIYRQLIQELPAAVYVCDAQGRIEIYNNAAVELWGREPIIGTDCWCGSFKIFHLDGSPMALDQCPMAVALTEGRSVRNEEIIVERPDGSQRNVLPFPSPIFDSAGIVVGAVNMLVDITDRRTAEKAQAQSKIDLRHSEDRLQTLISLLPAGVYACDAEGKIVFFNRRAAELWGCEPKLNDSQQKFCAFYKVFLLDGTFVPAENTPMAIAVRESKSFRDVEAIVHRPDGSQFIASINIDPILDASGRHIGAINVFQDITARKHVEAALKEAKDSAEAANRSKDRFLAVLSHELRTPLTPVLMSIAAMQVDPQLPPAMRQDIEMIRRNVELETKLIDDLLDLSRIAVGKLRLQPQAVDLNEAVGDACGICRGQILEKGIHLHCNFDPKAGSVSADPARLRQVLWNVLKNAAKFTPEGGNIHVATRRSENRKLRISITDDGTGIAPEILPRIFDAFEQGDAAITRQFGGLGLGLAISKALMELHGGSIQAQSEGPGKGSTFTMELPAHASTHNDRPSGEQPSASARPLKLRILVVEDHADTATVLGRLLRASGYAVKTALSAADALDLASREPFDLIVSDIGLPDVTGYELMQQISQRYPMKGIAMSGYGMDEDIKKSRQAGFCDHLVKPVSFAELEQAIRRLSESAAG